jgi:hypothetical protein
MLDLGIQDVQRWILRDWVGQTARLVLVLCVEFSRFDYSQRVEMTGSSPFELQSLLDLWRGSDKQILKG